MGTVSEKPWLGSYDSGVKHELTIPDEPLSVAYERVRKDFPDVPAFYFYGMTQTFEEMFSAADRFAKALADRGIGKNDVVAINLPNLPQYLIAQLGATRMGCWVSGMSPLLSGSEMAFQLKDSGAQALVTLDPIFEHRLLPVVDQLPDLKVIISTGILDFLPKFKQFMAKLLKKVPTGKCSPIPDKEVISFVNLLNNHSPNPPTVDIDPEDVHLLQYTGGTTGTPKGAMLTHRNVLSQAIIWNQWFHTEMGKDIACSGYPFFHVGGQCSLVATIWHGVTQILIPNPRDTKHIVKQIKKYRPNFINNVPSLYLMLMKTPGFDTLDFSSVRFATAAAAPFPVEPMKELEALIGGHKVVELYGLTETSPLITLNPTKGIKKIGSVGIPAPSTEVRLVNIASKEPVPMGEPGELIVSGPQVMKGYWKNDKETRIAIREHDNRKWLHTGDVAVMDEDGYFTIVDRIKDMINISGFKVFPREIEEQLYRHPFIEVCAVLGVKNPDRPETEMVKLVIQPSVACEGKSHTEIISEINSFCKENLGVYKKPKLIEIVDEIPMTNAGKVDKRALKQVIG